MSFKSSGHGSTTQNSHKVTHPNVHQRMKDKQNEVSPHSGMLFSHGKEWGPDTYYRIDEV